MLSKTYIVIVHYIVIDGFLTKKSTIYNQLEIHFIKEGSMLKIDQISDELVRKLYNEGIRYFLVYQNGYVFSHKSKPINRWGNATFLLRENGEIILVGNDMDSTG